MIFSKYKKTTNFFSALMATILLLEIFYPTISFASSQGIITPEVASFEPVDATDMVNLNSGDFSYVLPLLQLPSPEGGFPISMHYHAGVQMNQDASWVGLGWNLNLGSITRAVNGEADDWSESEINNIMADPGGKLENYQVSTGYSNAGVSVGLSGSWGTNKSFTVSPSIGLNYQFEGSGIGMGVQVNGYGGIMGNINVGEISVGVSFYNSKPNLFASSNSSMVGISLSSYGEASMTTPTGNYGMSNSNMRASSWSTHKTSFDASLMMKTAYGTFSASFGHSVLTYSYYQNQESKSSGTLYMENARESNGGGEQKEHRNMDFYSNPYNASTSTINSINLRSNALSFPAYDSYLLSGQGIEGSIIPYLSKFGTLSSGLNTQSIYDDAENIADRPKEELYYYNDGNVFNTNKPIFSFEGVHDSYMRVSTGYYGYNFVDSKIPDPVWYPGKTYSGGSLDYTNPDNLSNYNVGASKYGGGKMVQWFTNNEIINNEDVDDEQSLISKGFMETQILQNQRDNQDLFDPNGIGAYTITDDNGLTYHYSLPVYQFEQFYQNYDNSNTDKYFEQIRWNKYAYTWLLTGITGPDFIDRGNTDGSANGVIDQNDLGYWMKFDYGKWTDGYFWRTPSSGGKSDPINSNQKFKTFGRKQIYYLNSISSRTHTAYFIKNVREDGLGSTLSGDDLSDNGVTHHKVNWTAGMIDDFELVDGTYDLKSTPNCISGLSFDQYQNINNTFSVVKNKVLSLDKIIITKNNPSLSLTDLCNNSTNLITNSNASGSISFNRELQFKYHYVGCEGSGFNIPTNLDVTYRKERPLITFNSHFQNNVLDVNDDISQLESDAIRTLEFGYDYSLCENSPNSDHTNHGKLTLTTLQFFGKDHTSTMPPYHFNYYGQDIEGTTTDESINYNESQMDDWGYYKDNEKTWSLKQITTPTGALLDINYESDCYRREVVSTLPVYINRKTGSVYNLLTIDATHLSVEVTDASYLTDVSIGEAIHLYVKGTLLYGTGDAEVEVIGIVQSVDNTEGIILSTSSVPGYPLFAGITDAETLSYYEHFDQTFETNIYGGGIRVSEISATDESSNIYRTKYTYNASGKNYTSGVTSYAPGNKGYIPYIYEIPPPSVLYEYVTVSNADKNNVVSKSAQYQFEVLKNSEIYPNDPNLGNLFYVEDLQNETSGTYENGSHTSTVKSRSSVIHNNLASLGRLLKETWFNSRNIAVQTTEYEYYKPEELKAGIMQETFNESKRYLNWTEGHSGSSGYRYNTSSSRIKYPSVLKKITSNNSGNQTITEIGDKNEENNGFDFKTGQALIQKSRNSVGEIFIFKSVPAYSVSIYADMGSKVDDIDNKNMLVQEAATYVYKLAADGITKNYVSATVQTWKDTWDYRKYNTSTQKYENESQSGVWRKHKNYVYKDLLGANNEGTFTIDAGDDEDFDFSSSTQNAKWQNTGEVTLYDHFSKPLESKDINGNYAATKMGYAQMYPIASAGNATYTEFAYSGAEDADANGYDAEVLTGVRCTTSTYIHTGAYSSKATEGTTGFVYSTQTDNSSTSVVEGPKLDKKYRASVWVYATNASQAKLFVNSGSTELASATVTSSTKRAGDWYLLSLNFTLTSAVSDLKIGVKNYTGSGDVYFDDFRMHPLTATMNSTVYYADRGLIWANHDNENMGTKYEYDAAGRLATTFKEVLQSSGNAFKKVNENSYHYKGQ